MKKFHSVIKFSLAVVIFCTGCIVTFLMTREWVYSAAISEIKVVDVDGGDNLKVSLVSHPPWAQRHANTYVVNIDDMTIKIVSSYVVWSPFSIHESSMTNITDFHVFIPGDALTEGTYELQHYGQSNIWKSVGVVDHNSSGKLNYSPHEKND